METTGDNPKPLSEILARPNEVIDAKPSPKRKQDAEVKRLTVETDEHAQRRDDHLMAVESEGLTEDLHEAMLNAAHLTEEARQELERAQHPTDPSSG